MSDMSDLEDEPVGGSSVPGGPYDPKRHAREQHNALERRRRDNIKDMYTSLREVVPEAGGERVQASRAVILKKAIETIEKGQSDGGQLAVEVAEQEAKNARVKEEVGTSMNENSLTGKVILQIARLKAKKAAAQSDSVIPKPL